MRDATRLIGLAGLLFVAVALRPAAAATSASTEAEITRLEDDWRTARIKGDTAFLEHFYAKDLVIQGMNGSALPRDEDIPVCQRADQAFVHRPWPAAHPVDGRHGRRYRD